MSSLDDLLHDFHILDQEILSLLPFDDVARKVAELLYPVDPLHLLNPMDPDPVDARIDARIHQLLHERNNIKKKLEPILNW